MTSPRRPGVHDLADQPRYMPLGDILRDKPMKATTKGVVVAHCDAAMPSGVARHVILLAWGNTCVSLVVWREQAHHVARIAEESMDKVICMDKVKYTQFKGESQLEIMNDSQITLSPEEPPSINFPWMSFTSIPLVDDYQRVHLCASISDVGDVTPTQTGDYRLALRLKDQFNNVIDIVAWRQFADASLWSSGSKVEIFFGQVNRDRRVVEVNHESRIRCTPMPVQMFPSASASHMVQWAPYKRTKKSNTQ